MPWKETCPMDERKKFIKAWCRHEETFAALCARFGIARKTGYKLVERFEREGLAGLEPRSRAPHYHPNGVDEAVEKAVLSLRRRFPRWGPDKLLVKLAENAPELAIPSRSTVARMLNRHGLVRERRRRRHASPTAHPLTDSTQANAVWSIDYKGQFRLGNGQLCYPLTLCDHYSRYVLCCQGFPNIRLDSVKALLERVFRDYGLPEVIRSDNGAPFASTGLGGLTRLSLSWIKLGIQPERIQPGTWSKDRASRTWPTCARNRHQVSPVATSSEISIAQATPIPPARAVRMSSKTISSTTPANEQTNSSRWRFRAIRALRA